MRERERERVCVCVCVLTNLNPNPSSPSSVSTSVYWAPRASRGSVTGSANATCTVPADAVAAFKFRGTRYARERERERELIRKSRHPGRPVAGFASLCVCGEDVSPSRPPGRKMHSTGTWTPGGGGPRLRGGGGRPLLLATLCRFTQCFAKMLSSSSVAILSPVTRQGVVPFAPSVTC